MSVTFEASDVLNSARKIILMSEGRDTQELYRQKWNPLICIMALSNVAGLSIFSIYPESGDEFVVLLSNALMN